MAGYRATFLLLVVAGVICVAGCREEGNIQISGLTFNGVKQVDKDALANALQTKKGSWIPWSRKRFFDRRAFEADLKRIEAFYRDRGFPDARVRSFDVKLNDAQDKVDITLDISEGEPIRVESIELRGFDVIPADRPARAARDAAAPARPPARSPARDRVTGARAQRPARRGLSVRRSDAARRRGWAEAANG